MSSLTPKEGGMYHPPTPPSGRTPVWIPVILIVAIIGLAAVGYGQYSSNSALQAKISLLEDKLQENAAKVTSLQKADTSLASDIEVVTKKVGVTDQELASARKYAEKIRQDAEASKAQLASELEKKASATDVAKVGQDVVAAREEAKAKVEEVQKTADAKIGAVSGDVKAVDARVDATNRDVAESKRALADATSTLNSQIAKTNSDLGALRLKGEREYFEFDLKKAKKDEMQRVGDIRLALKDVDTKKQKYNLMIQVDDNKLEKKDKLINEPVQFLVGREKLRYEVVVNKVDKDHVVGYLSTPKDKTLSAERPASRE